MTILGTVCSVASPLLYIAGFASIVGLPNTEMMIPQANKNGVALNSLLYFMDSILLFAVWHHLLMFLKH